MTGSPMAGSLRKVWEAFLGSSPGAHQVQGVPEAGADLSTLPVQLCWEEKDF